MRTRLFPRHRYHRYHRYHLRSNVESTMGVIKAKFGEALRGKGQAAQCTEALCKVLCHNLCYLIQRMHEFGISTGFAGASAS